MMDVFLCGPDDITGDWPPCPHPDVEPYPGIDPPYGCCLTCEHKALLPV